MLFRKKYVLLLVLALCGCGFEPLYVEKKHDNMWYYGGDFDTSISQEMAQISIEPISQRFGQIMRNELIDLLTPKGTPKSPKYRLFVHLTEKTRFRSGAAFGHYRNPQNGSLQSRLLYDGRHRTGVER